MSAGGLAGRVAVVSGGAGGIGAAVVARFAAEGARVASLDRAAPAPGAPCLHVAADVADEPSVRAAFLRIDAALGGADILVCCAGIAALAPLEATDAALVDALLAVNVRGSLVCVREAVVRMRARGGGRIVLLGSISGQAGNPWRAAYAASKGAVTAMARALAVELAPHGILVNVIAPGPVETPMVAAMQAAGDRAPWLARVPLGRYARPEEIAGAALFLAGPDAAFITGQVLAVDGGFLAAGVLPAADPLRAPLARHAAGVTLPPLGPIKEGPDSQP